MEGRSIRVKPDRGNADLYRRLIDLNVQNRSVQEWVWRVLPERRLTEGAGGFQTRDFVPGQAHFERHFLGMLAEFGRRAMRLRGDVAKLDGAVHDAASGNIRMVDGGESADSFGLRIVEHFGVGADGRPDEIVAIENRRPLVGSS